LSHTRITEYATPLPFTLSGKIYKYGLELRMYVVTQNAYISFTVVI